MDLYLIDTKLLLSTALKGFALLEKQFYNYALLNRDTMKEFGFGVIEWRAG